jgi:hypothetical protein
MATRSADGYQLFYGAFVYIRVGGEYPPGRYRASSMKIASINPNRRKSLRLEPPPDSGRTKGCWRSPDEVYRNGDVARGLRPNGSQRQEDAHAS